MGRYSAFISYSHADSAVASWLHRAIEGYRVPKALVGTDGPEGKVARRLKPAFRDRDELAVSTDLGADLRAALSEADHQIVICSERAAASKWVNEEILAYKQMHGEKRTYALIVSGEPYKADGGCFPRALCFKVGPDGALSDIPAQPIAADMRPGKDGRRLALLKLIAGLTGARLDSLVRRDEQRRRRRLYWIAGGSSSVTVVTAGLAVYANAQRIEANHQRIAAEQQRATAEASLDFLIGTFKIANPATENPRTISAVTLLDRVSDRVKVELKSQPAVSARLLRATGEIYGNLGLPKESERDLVAALARTPPKSEVRAVTLLQLARLADTKGDEARLGGLIKEAEDTMAGQAMPSPPLRSRLMEMQGRRTYLAAQYNQSAGFFARSMAVLEEAPGDSRSEVARLGMLLGRSLSSAGKFQDAATAFSRAESTYRSLFGPDHAETAKAMQNRAYSLFEVGKMPEASARITKAISVYERVLDPSNPIIADASLLKGRILHAEGRFDESAESFGKALSLYRRSYGRNDYRVGDVSFYSAQTLSDSGKFSESLEMLAQAKHVYDVAYGALDPDQVEVLKARAQIRRAAGDADGSGADCRAAVALQRRLEPQGTALAELATHCQALAADPPQVALRFATP